MKCYRQLFPICLVALCCANSSAQEPAEFPAPEKEHQWLEQFVGKWESTSECSMGPDQPPMKSAGSMTSRMLGGFWVISEVSYETPGSTMNAIQTIGYDPAKKKYVGTWVDSATSHMWNYEGTVDESGKVLALDAEGPNFMADGKMTTFRDAYEFKSPDIIISTSSILMDDGKWVTFMTGEMRRVK